MNIDSVQPEGWRRPSGYSNAIVVEGSARTCYVAGQIAWDADGRLVGGDDFVAQFRQALSNVAAVVGAAGGVPANVVDMTIYVTDKRAYSERLTEIGSAYRDVMGSHYPAMALVQVADLLEEGALVEIRATAALE